MPLAAHSFFQFSLIIIGLVQSIFALRCYQENVTLEGNTLISRNGSSPGQIDCPGFGLGFANCMTAICERKDRRANRTYREVHRDCGTRSKCMRHYEKCSSAGGMPRCYLCNKVALCNNSAVLFTFPSRVLASLASFIICWCFAFFLPSAFH